MFDRGGIYLAKLYPSRGHEPGKTRPVLILQSDMLNHVGHSTVIVLPLTTQLIPEAFPLRYPIGKRERLEHDSEILCDQIRAIDTRRLLPQKLATLSDDEMTEVAYQVQLILDFSL